MDNLLKKSRRINRLLQRSAGQPVDFHEMAIILTETVRANVYVVDKKGKILGHHFVDGFECNLMLEEVIERGLFPDDYNQGLLKINQTKANIEQKEGRCVFKIGEDCIFKQKLTTIVPINGAAERLGTLILARFSEEFLSDDLILAEYGATVVGMEILRSKTEKMEEEARKKAAVDIAVETLSYSELEAVGHIFAKLAEKDDDILVASKVADDVGITRSVIVNALRKLESAGVIESRSLGMKGTFIRVLNDRLLEKIESLASR